MGIRRIIESITARQIALIGLAATVLTMVAAWAAYWLVSEQLTQTRELTSQQFFIQFYSQWESEDMQRRRARLAKTWLNDPKAIGIDDAPLVLLETIANATRRGLVDQELVYTTFSIDIVNYGYAADHYINYLRQTESDPEYFKELIQLRNRFLSKQPPKALAGVDSESVRRYLELESRRAGEEGTAP